MIVSETLLNKARSAFDLNEYEIKTWIAILSRNESTAGELAEISTVPRSRVYDILESLTDKGFVTKKSGSPIKYKAVAPKEALTAAKRNAMSNAKEISERFDKVKATPLFKELGRLYKKGSEALQSDIAGVIKGRDNIHAHLNNLISGSKNSLTIVTTKKGMLRKADKLGAELKDAKKRGVSVRIAAPMASFSDLPAELHNVAEFKNAKGHDARFVIADGKSVMFMLNHDEEVHEAYDFGILVNAPFVAKSFEHLFENAWKSMDKISK